MSLGTFKACMFVCVNECGCVWVFACMTDNFTSFSHTILTYRSGTALVLMLNLRFVVVRKSSHLVHLVSTSGKKKQSSGDPADIPNDENCLWHVLLYAHAVVSSGMILLWSCSGSENVILISPPQDISSDLKMYLEHNEEHLDLYLDLPFCRAITQDD